MNSLIELDLNPPEILRIDRYRISSILRKAAHVLSEGNWIRYRRFDDMGGACVLGAISRAVHKAYMPPMVDLMERKTIRVLEQHVPPLPYIVYDLHGQPREPILGMALARWNDHLVKDQADVIKLLLEVAEIQKNM